MVTSDGNIMGVQKRKEKNIDTVLYVPERLQGSSVNTQKVMGNYCTQLERSRGRIIRAHYD